VIACAGKQMFDSPFKEMSIFPGLYPNVTVGHMDCVGIRQYVKSISEKKTVLF